MTAFGKLVAALFIVMGAAGTRHAADLEMSKIILASTLFVRSSVVVFSDSPPRLLPPI